MQRCDGAFVAWKLAQMIAIYGVILTGSNISVIFLAHFFVHHQSE